MNLMDGGNLQRLVASQMKLSECLLPELVRRLILCSRSCIDSIRFPSMNDVWAPGFDGIVQCGSGSTYVPEGLSVWECGTNADSLKKVNADYQKRTDDSLGINKSGTTFLLVVPRVWAYDNQGASITKWESEHQGVWKNVRIYDAVTLAAWLNSEPAVCAWFLEQFGQTGRMELYSVNKAWEKFANLTAPALSHSMFTADRDEASKKLIAQLGQKIIRVKGASQKEAYGFCLSVLLQDQEASNNIVVIGNENTYYQLSRDLTGKTFLLSFSFSGQVSDSNHTIVCYSKQDIIGQNGIELHPLWKSQFTKALQDMGIPHVKADEHYAFSHGNILALIRRIPGNAAEAQPGWASIENANKLRALVFLRNYSVTSDIDKQALAEISGTDYSELEECFEGFLKLEDPPLKKVENHYLIISREEAWLTLKIDITDSASKRAFDVVIKLLSECKDNKDAWYSPQASVIHRLVYNYLFYAETGSDENTINKQVTEILSFSHYEGSKKIVLSDLHHLAEAAPDAVLSFLLAESNAGSIFQTVTDDSNRSNCFSSVRSAFEQLIETESTAIQACNLLYKLCQAQGNPSNAESLRGCLRDSLCLWSCHAALMVQEKSALVTRFIQDDPSFGVPFAIDVLCVDSLARGVRFGKKEVEPQPCLIEESQNAYLSISTNLLEKSIQLNQIDWLEKAFQNCFKLPCAAISSAVDLFERTDYTPEQLVSFSFVIHLQIYRIRKYNWEDREPWLEQLSKWATCLDGDDPVLRYGWIFYQYHKAPCLEFLQGESANYSEYMRRVGDLRKDTIATVREAAGMEAVIRLIRCMENDLDWGILLANALTETEYRPAIDTLVEQNKLKILSGLLDSIELTKATEIFTGLSTELQKQILPLLGRDDIDFWLTSEQLENLYWKQKRLYIGSRQNFDNEYSKIRKYNPCGALPLFLNDKFDLDSPESNRVIYEVFRSIADSDYNSDPGLLAHIVQVFDKQFYTDEWAELCLRLYNKKAFGNNSDFYPKCLQTYFYRHPGKALALYNSNERLFWDHFAYHYCLPEEAYEDLDLFVSWCDSIYGHNEPGPEALANVLGRAKNGSDGIFPHEFVREVLERYNDSRVTTRVANEKQLSAGMRIVQDGLREHKTAEKYRQQAKSLELNYPQSARILKTLARFLDWESQEDQEYAELYLG